MNSNSIKKNVWQNPSYFIAFGFGSGLLPKMPGTWGTLAAIPLCIILSDMSVFSYLLVVLALFMLGITVCENVTNDLQVHDFSGVVIDEMVGLLITLFTVPLTVITVFLGFLFFRLFDIWKPGIIKLVDKKVKGGFGIMLDDVLAAIPAWILLKLTIWLFF